MPRCRGVGTPSWAGPLTTSLRGLWVSGYLPRAMGGDPKTDHVGTTRTPGWHPEEKATLVTATQPTKVLSKPAWTASVPKGAGAQRPHCEKGKGPENPGVVAPLAVAGCRGNLRRGGPIRYDVAASYYLICYDAGGRRAAGLFILASSPSSLLALGFCSLSFSFTSATLEVWPTLSVVLVVVFCLPNVTPSAPCRRALKVSGSRPSCLRLTSLFPQRVSSLWTT